MRESLKLAKNNTDILELDDYPESIVLPESDGYYKGSQINLRSYWRGFIKYIWLVILITVAGTALMLVHEAHKPDFYVAWARVQVNTENNPALGALKNAPVVLNTQVNDPAYFSTQLQILEGSGLLRRVIKTLDLEHNRMFLHPQAGQDRSTWQNIKRMLGFGDQTPKIEPAKDNRLTLDTNALNSSYTETEEDAERLAPYVGFLRNGLEIEPVKETRVAYKETRLIDIIYTHNDPQVAAKVANAVADTYVLSNLENKVQTNAAAGDFLQKRVAELQAQIRNGEERLINYAKEHQILSLDDKQNTVVQRLIGLNSQLAQAENERSVAEAAYRASLAPGAASSMAEGTDTQTAALEAKLLDLKQQRLQLLAEYTETAPEVVEIDKQIRSVQQSISERQTHSTETLTTNLATKYRQALARENELRGLFDQQRGQVLGQNEAAINYRIIQQEIDTNKSLLDGLLQRSKENDVVLNDTPNNVLVVDRALVPQVAAGPRRAGHIIIAFFISLGLGVGLTILINFLDNSVSTSEDIESSAKLPVIGAIPSATSASRVRKFLPLVGKILKKRSDGRSALITENRGHHSQIESYLHLRTSLLLSSAGGPPNVILVTSSQPSEGKTTTAINLAITLSQTGDKVLIIDGDLRRPKVHYLLSLNNEKGLTTILANGGPQEPNLLDIVQKSDETGLYVLTAGPASPNPANLLSSQQMNSMLRTLRSEFDYIIVDSPPAVLFTDSAILSSVVDGVLLVVRSGESSRTLLQRGSKMLRDVGANVIGVILNDIPAASQDYKESYSYEYQYSDKKSEKKEVGGYLGLNA